MLRHWLHSLLAPAPAPNLRATAASPLDLSMMARALELARAAAAIGEVPVGAVVYNHTTGQIISEAHNRRETDHDPAAHAELIAIRAAAASQSDWRLNHLSLAVTLEPCCMCAGTIINARIGRLIFAARDPKAGFCGSLQSLTQHPALNHRIQPIEGPLASESSTLLKEFFKARRSKPKT
jgi:tRNA(adenine34) deaminase